MKNEIELDERNAREGHELKSLSKRMDGSERLEKRGGTPSKVSWWGKEAYEIWITI